MARLLFSKGFLQQVGLHAQVRIHPLIKRIAAHKAHQAGRLISLCEQAHMTSPKVTAAQITFLLEGAQITAQNGSIDDLGTLLMSMIDSILGTAPQRLEVSVGKTELS